jgi:hypothetical protein
LKHTKLRTGAAILALVAMAGCAQSPIPLAGNFDLTEQKKVRSAGHWQIVARDAAQQTLKMLDNAGVASNARVTVPSMDKATTFEKTFYEMLVTELVNAGRRVTLTEQNPLQVTYKVQLVVHNSPRPHFIPGVYTALTSGVYAAYGLSAAHVDAKLLGGLGLAAAADHASSVYSGGPTATELVLTTSAATPDQILSRKTDVYYLENVDASLFKQPTEHKTMKVVSQ